MHLALQGLLPGLTPPNQTGYFLTSFEALLGNAVRLPERKVLRCSISFPSGPGAMNQTNPRFHVKAAM